MIIVHPHPNNIMLFLTITNITKCKGREAKGNIVCV